MLSYAAFKLRDKRKPKGSGEKPHFFERFSPEDARALLPPEEP